MHRLLLELASVRLGYLKKEPIEEGRFEESAWKGSARDHPWSLQRRTEQRLVAQKARSQANMRPIGLASSTHSSHHTGSVNRTAIDSPVERKPAKPLTQIKIGDMSMTCSIV